MIRRCLIISIFFLSSLINLIHAQTANSLYEGGISKFKQNDLNGAIAEFTKCITKNEIFYDAYISRGDCYIAQKKINEALKDFSKALEIYPNFYPAYIKRAEAYSLSGDDKKAFADYAKAIEINKDNVEAYLCRSKLYQKNNELKQALNDLNIATKLSSQSAEVFFQRAQVYEKQKKDKEAITDFSTAIRLKPEYAEAYYQRGKQYIKLNEYSAAVKDFDKAIELKILNKDIFTRKALAAFKSGNWIEAIDAYNVLVNTYEVNEPDLFYNRGICYSNTGKPDEALKNLIKATQLNPKNDSAYVRIADLHAGQNNLKNAQIYYNKAISVNPGNNKAYAGRAKIFFILQKYEQAIQDWNFAIKSLPDPEWFFQRSLCKESLKDKKGMCEDLKSAADLGLKKAAQKMEHDCKEEGQIKLY